MEVGLCVKSGLETIFCSWKPVWARNRSLGVIFMIQSCFGGFGGHFHKIPYKDGILVDFGPKTGFLELKFSRFLKKKGVLNFRCIY